MAVIEELLSRITGEGGFDVEQTTALAWLDARHKLMVARARNHRLPLLLGVTVVGQRDYAVPESVIEIRELTVGGVPYGEGRHRDFAEGAQGWIWLSGPPGAGVSAETGERLVGLYPTPSTAGLPIAIYAIVRAPALDVSLDETLKVPPEFHDALVAGAIATGLARIEGRADLAVPHEQVYDAACAELTKQSNRLYRPAGPIQIRVAGYNS